jgi:hypothetical protein
VIQTVREKFSCRHCEKISQPPAPLHATPRGWAGPNLLATILFDKLGQHQPLNRQAERYAREGVGLSLSTLADQVGACAAALAPVHALIRGQCPASRAAAWGRHHGAAAGEGRNEERRPPGSEPMSATIAPFAGGAPPAALFYLSRDREMVHPQPASRETAGHPPGRRLWRIQRPLSRRPRSRPGEQRAVLEPRPAQVLRTRRHQGEGLEEDAGARHLARRWKR